MSWWDEGSDDAAVGLDALAAEAVVEDADEEHDADFDRGEGDGYPDPTLTVRLWLDDNRRLARVWVSNKWRRRTRERSLSALFSDALTLANAQVLPPPAVAYVDVEAGAPLSWGALSEAADRATAHTRVSDVATREAEAEPDRVEPEETVGHDAQRVVSVTLGPSGQTTLVAFDEDWLGSVKVDDLVDAVMEAHAHAYAAFVPGHVVPGPLSEVVDANAALALEVDALLRRGTKEE